MIYPLSYLFHFFLLSRIKIYYNACINLLFIMSETEYHVIRISVNILKTLLSVRFPCSLHFQLKAGTLYITQKEQLPKAVILIN